MQLSEKTASRTVLILMLGVAVIGCNSFLLSPVLNDTARDFGVSVEKVATAISAYGGATALSSLFLAPYAVRKSLTGTIRWGGMILVLSFIISGLSVSWFMLTFAQFLAGIAAGLMLPAVYGLVPLIVPPDRHSSALGRILTGWSLAMVIGIPTSALLTDFISWRAAYALAASGGCAFIFLCKNIPATETEDIHSLPGREYFSRPDMLSMFMVTLLYMTAFYGLYSYVGTWAREHFHNSATQASAVTLAYGAGFGLASMKASLVDRFTPAACARIIFLLLGLTYACFPFTERNLAVFLTGCLFWGIINHFGLNVIVSLLISLCPEHRIASLGIYSALSYGGTMAGGLIYGSLFGRYGFNALCFMSAGMCVFSVLVTGMCLSGKPAKNTSP